MTKAEKELIVLHANATSAENGCLALAVIISTEAVERPILWISNLLFIVAWIVLRFVSQKSQKRLLEE